MLIEMAVILLQNPAPTAVRPADAVCYASPREEQGVVFAISKGFKANIAARGLTRIDCPAEFSWTAEIAERHCAFLAHYDEEQRNEYMDYYGLSPDEVCSFGREAAGLSPNPMADEKSR